MCVCILYNIQLEEPTHASRTQLINGHKKSQVVMSQKI